MFLSDPGKPMQLKTMRNELKRTECLLISESDRRDKVLFQEGTQVEQG